MPDTVCRNAVRDDPDVVVAAFPVHRLPPLPWSPAFDGY